jgi:hypothetical protein
MLRIGLCVALGLGVVCVVDGLDSQVPMQGRSLLQGNETTVPAKIRVANLTNVLNTTGDVLLDEQELQGSIDVTSSSEPVLYGTYFLGPSELAEINHTIATELVRFYMLLQPCVPFLIRGKMPCGVNSSSCAWPSVRNHRKRSSMIKPCIFEFKLTGCMRSIR